MSEALAAADLATIAADNVTPIRSAHPGRGSMVPRPNLTGAVTKHDDEPKKKAKAKAPDPERRGRPIILLATGEIAGVVDEAEKAIVDADLGIYQRGGKIVYVGNTVGKGSKGEPVHGQAILEVGDYALQEALSTAALWEKFDGRSGGNVFCNPPMEIARTLKQREGRRNMPVLRGFANAPLLRADGSILETEGYDEASGLVLDFDGVVYPKVPEFPTRQEAGEALAMLDALLDGFPFVSGSEVRVMSEDKYPAADAPRKPARVGHHRSAALSMMLSAVVRRSLDFCPIHGVTASTPGTGKSLLADLPALLLNGNKAFCSTWTGDVSEDRKSLHGMLFDGLSTIQIDNVKEGLEVGGSFLNTMLTSEQMAVRVLGSSTAPIVNTGAFLTATGNNLVFVSDMSRRVIFCAMEANMERPETRSFAFNPVTVLKAHRPEYLVAALTVLRAMAVAGFPDQQLIPLGGFELWEAWIRGALVWLGHVDPVVSQNEVRELDPERVKHLALLETWHEAFGSNRQKARDVVAVAGQRGPGNQNPDHSFTPGNLKFPALRDAIVAVAAGGPDRPDATKLGYYVKGLAGRIVGNMKFARGKDLNGSATWCVEKVDAN